MSEQDTKTEAACDKIAQYHFDFNSPRQCHSHHLLSRQIRRAVSFARDAGKAAGRAEMNAEAIDAIEFEKVNLSHGHRDICQLLVTRVAAIGVEQK